MLPLRYFTGGGLRSGPFRVLWILLAGSGLATAQPSEPSPGAPEPPAVAAPSAEEDPAGALDRASRAAAEEEFKPRAPEPVAGTDDLRIGPLVISPKTREVRFPVRLALREGILEYLLVDEQGKTYESVFKSAGFKGSELNFALLLVGCDPVPFSRFEEWLAAETPPAPETFPAASRVVVELRQNGQPVAWERILRAREGEGAPDFTWLVTGGFFTEDGRYAADFNKSLIALWRDPSAPVNCLSRSGNPYRGALGFEMNVANPDLAVDQEFELVLRAR